MNISVKLSSTWRLILKAIAIYAAAAWAAIEVIDFAVSKYGLSRFILDVAVLVSLGGGMVTGVLAWFHGGPGPQKAKASEIIIIISIIVTTAAGVSYLATPNSPDAFNELEGYRLTFEFLNISDSRDEDYMFVVQPLESTVYLDEKKGVYNLKPDNGFMKGRLIEIKFEEYPVMMLAPDDSEWMKVIFVLPFEPIDVADLRKTGTLHDSAKFGTRNLSVTIETSFEIIEQQSGVTIRIID